MIKIMALNKNNEIEEKLSLQDLKDNIYEWFWIDLYEPSKDEESYLRDNFEFHPLALEDSFQSYHRPKLDYYEDHNFFILNSLNEINLNADSIGVFISEKYIISVHLTYSNEIEEAWEKVLSEKKHWHKGTYYVFYAILDKIVDEFFPAISDIEEELEEIDVNEKNESINKLMERVFDIRSDLLKLRKIVNSMRDLLYRILESERLNLVKAQKVYFGDIYDHLIKLSDMLENSREITSDMRDSYISINSNKMNANMMVLTVISTIFMPLTFIVGIYGMNFENMPELQWRYGYSTVLIVMLVISFVMFTWFKRKGWFDNLK